MTRKGTFQPGDLAIYFEIDSKVDTNKPEFSFLASKHGKIKTQKYTFGGKGNFVSQGLLMSMKDFPNFICEAGLGNYKYVKKSGLVCVGDFLTKELGVTYADAADNKRKSNGVDKYKKMASRHPKLFRNPIIKRIYKTKFGKKLLFVFFGKSVKKTEWPSWVVKTDEERCQNLPMLFPGDKTKWIATEKIDGTSTTFTMKGFGRKRVFKICSRNVVFDKPDKKCFYDTNVYLEMADKYNIEKVLTDILDDNKNILNFITLQGETYGNGIQKRDYCCSEHCFMAFNLIFGYKDGTTKRFNPIEMTDMLSEKYGIPCVPIVSEEFYIPETCEELLNIATGASKIDGGMREGLVFRTEDGVRSFKAVSNEFLLKYHQ